MASLQINAMPFMGENISLLTQVNYFDQTDLPIDIIPAKMVTLIASGEEFEYYMSLLDKPTVIKDLVVAKIEEADQNGRFN